MRTDWYRLSPGFRHEIRPAPALARIRRCPDAVMSFDWRRLSPRSNTVLVPLALAAAIGLAYVEQGKHVAPSPWYQEMHRAAEISAAGMGHLKRHRLERGVFVDAVNDPAQTALIGQEYTQITTDRGYLEAKIASTDPNLAAVVVDMMRELRVDSGSCVAVGMTGSFPALNLSVLAALEALDMKAVVISSVGSSNFGANDPYFTWLDMERELHAQGILSRVSAAASLGGGNDTGRGLSPRGRSLLREAIARNGIPLIAAQRLEASIRERLRRFEEGCAPQEIAVYVNVGGGVASLGHSLNAVLVPNGPSELVPQRNYPARGVLLRLNARGVPVIHLLNLRQLLDRYGLEPIEYECPPPGRGGVFGQTRYSLPRTFAVTGTLVGLFGGLFLLDRRAHRLGVPGPEGDA